MSASMAFTFKTAETPEEFEQIHEMNYRTFVEEIPQHAPNRSKKLIDKFHHENTYLVCLREDKLVGMVAVRGKRPFSLDMKLGNIESFLPKGRKICEIRLLAVEPNRRKTQIFVGLMRQMLKFCRTQGYNLAIISGTTRQQKLYSHFGFVPFGPAVGTDGARFQPMYVTSELFAKHVGRLFPEDNEAEKSAPDPVPEIFLPGPVAIRGEVQAAFNAPAISHRSAVFMSQMQDVRDRLSRLVKSRHSEVMVGSGTLANDVVAAQLALTDQPGLLLSNGEFGTRLVDHATRAGLVFEVLNEEWGGVYRAESLLRMLDQYPRTAWVWAVHCESSTGVLNDLAMLKSICARRGVRLCMDCTSSVGTVPVDLAGVYLASSVSGKGLGAMPGLSFVFYSHAVSPAPKRLPRYLDLGLYAEHDGVPFTHSSNLLAALDVALRRYETEAPFVDLAELGAWLRTELRVIGFQLVAADEHAAPAIATMALPSSISSKWVGEQLEKEGFLLSYRSGYLLRWNWIQISIMGECSKTRLMPLLERLKTMNITGRSAPGKSA